MAAACKLEGAVSNQLRHNFVDILVKENSETGKFTIVKCLLKFVMHTIDDVHYSQLMGN